jgi:pectate lyase
MKKLIFLTTLFVTLAATAQEQSEYDQNAPFGFCTVSSRTNASSTYDITGGGCYTYPVPASLADKTIVLTADGTNDMKGAIQNAIKRYDIVVLDGSNGDFIISSSIGFERGNKTLLGINNARLCTQWYVTDEIKAALDAAGVPNMSTSGGGGTLSNGKSVSEEAEYHTRQIIINLTGDSNESYRNAGILSLNKSNVIIRNITFVGPGSIDVGGADLISATGAKNCWVDHCAFIDGEDGNFDITNKSDFITVSWCSFSYTSRSYMHQNTNLIGSSDSETTGYLNTTFAFNWWGANCKQRMPMARVGKIHMLNNYFSSTTASNCINPRKNSEFLIEGNYFAKGVKKYYKNNDATAVTWASSNHAVESNSLGSTSSFGSTVTVPYDYTVAPYSDVPTAVQEHAGATLNYSSDPSGITLPTSSIERQSSAIYNLAGQRVTDSFRGIVIKNGKKVKQ